MWTLGNIATTAFPTTDAGIPLAQIALSQSGGGVPLCICDLIVNPSPLVTPVAIATITPIVIPSPINPNQTQVPIPNVTGITTITAGSTTFVNAVDPVNPNPGEFVFNKNTGTATIYTGIGYLLTPGLTIEVFGISSISIPTDWVNPGLFEVFFGIPIVGTISWTRTFEQHPSGSASLTVLQDGIGVVRSRFRKGTELEFAGIGFSVTSYSEHLLNTYDYPGGAYEVNISFTGKWNRRRYNKPIKLRDVSSQITVFDDPDCALGGIGGNNPTPTTTGLSLVALAAKNGVTLQCAGTDWYVKIPPSTPGDAQTSWTSEFTERLRQNRAYALYSDPRQVQAINIGTVGNWGYTLPELEYSSQGDFEHNDGKFGYAVEYANFTMNGGFNSSGGTNSSPKPDWKQREPIKQTITNGDTQIDSPPANTTSLTTLDLNWDTSGPTKTQEITETEDGLPVRKTINTWGFMYLATDIYDAHDIEKPVYLSLQPQSYWKQVKQEVEVFNYDVKTGYLLSSIKTGWQYVRFATENATPPPSMHLDPVLNPDEAADNYPYLQMYKFRKAPINGATGYFLEQYLDYYKDAEIPPVIVYKVCNSDGSSTLKSVIDPTYVPAMFVSTEVQHNNTFIWSTHPDNLLPDNIGDPDYRRVPDLISGEESMHRRNIKVLASGQTTLSIGGTDANSKTLGDRYIEYSSQFSATGSGFRDAAEDTKGSEHDGRPQIATRKPSLLTLVAPESTDPNEIYRLTTLNKYAYHLTTPGYTVTDAIGGTLSYPHAYTLNTATDAAKTDLTIRDAQESVQFSYSIPFNAQIKEFDKVSISTGFDNYPQRVLSATNSVTITGSINGIPIVTCPSGTKISAGISRTIPVTVTAKPIPSFIPNLHQDNLTTINIISKDIVLGQILPSTFATRRNNTGASGNNKVDLNVK